MSVKSKVLAAATALTLAGGSAAAAAFTAGTATAATPSCARNCIDIFSRSFGTHSDPGFVLDVLRQRAKAGQPVILFRQSNSDPGEDFTISFQGQVSAFTSAGLISAAVALHYGGVGCQQYNASASNCTKFYPDDYAYEIEYSPYGVHSGLCMGTSATAGSGTPVSLQRCGASARTLWIADLTGSTRRSLQALYVPLINGSQTSFSNPYVLTYPQNARPADQARARLVTQAFVPSSHHGTVNNNQEWGGDFGVLP